MNYKTIGKKGQKEIKLWINGVECDEKAKQQLYNLSTLPFIYHHIAVMPDVHVGKGSTIGAVIPTLGAIIPAAVGVDIGCGMIALQTTLKLSDLPKDLKKIRLTIEKAVPHGRTDRGGKKDVGAWRSIPHSVQNRWKKLEKDYEMLCKKHPKVRARNTVKQLGTLGTGNHFIELCVDTENKNVWIMLHSGSRGCGNRIGTYFINLAKNEIKKKKIKLADPDLAYFEEKDEYFKDYIDAVHWAQKFANENRLEMLDNIIKALKTILPKFELTDIMVNCHHNYVQKENHFGKDVWITRKGAVSAQKGELGIIPGSMGTKSFIVRGLGNKDSFCSCSHGSGRVLSRTQAKKTFSLEEHINATKGIECRKDKGVLDETPKAYKNINAVINAQKDLIEVLYTLNQIICVKG